MYIILMLNILNLFYPGFQLFTLLHSYLRSVVLHIRLNTIYNNMFQPTFKIQ